MIRNLEIQEISLEEFATKYVTNKYRLDIYRYLLQTILVDYTLNVSEFYVIGSFISEKVFPSDLDLIIPVSANNEKYEYTQKLKQSLNKKLHIYFAYNIEELDADYIFTNIIKNPDFTNINIVKVKIGK